MSWISQQVERIVGYEPVGPWRIYRLDPARRRGGSLPERIPVPKQAWKQWGRRHRPDRLTHAQVAAYARQFVTEHADHPLAGELATLVKKAPLAAKVEEALALKAWEDAETLLHEVHDIDPTDQRARLLTGLCLLERGQVEKAEAVLAELETSLREEADLHLLRGRLAERKGELERAKACYRDALAIQDDHPVVLERMAFLGEMVEIFLGDLDDLQKAFVPREAYEKVIVDSWKSEPRDLDFYLERSEFHLRNGQPSLALEAADRALEKMANRPGGDAAEGREAAEREAETGTRTTEAGEDEPARVAEGGEVAPDAAAEGENDAPARAGEGRAAEAEVRAARCRALIALERFADAEAALSRLEKLDPEGEATLACRGQLLWFTGHHEKAGEVIRAAIAANPNRMENLNLFLDGDFPRQGVTRVDELKSLAKTYPQSWAVKGITATLAMAQGDWQKGAALAVEAASLGAADDLLIELTGRMGRQGLHDEIGKLIAWAGGWKRFQGSHPMLRCNVAATLAVGGKQADARTLYESVIEDADAHPEVRLRAQRALAEPERSETP